MILDVGNENGFVSNAGYHEDMTFSLFEEEYTNKLLPNILPNYVIVMDNASIIFASAGILSYSNQKI